jgi:hypothetical protein
MSGQVSSGPRYTPPRTRRVLAIPPPKFFRRFFAPEDVCLREELLAEAEMDA